MVLDAALYYQSRGISVIPVKPDKKPYFEWEPYKTKIASQDEIREWFKKYPEAMIAIVTGKTSGLFAIDFDTHEVYQSMQEDLPDTLETWTAQTPRGYHMYFKYPEKDISNKNGLVDKVDVRGEGGYIIAAPSINKDGVPYKWMLKPSKHELADIPEDFCKLYDLHESNINNLYKSQQVTTTSTSDNISSFFTSGRRDEDLFHAAHCLIKGGCDPDFATKVLEIIGRNTSPPFPEKEIQTKIQSALKRSEKKDRNLTSDIRDWVVTTNGIFTTTDVYSCQQLTTRHEKKCANVALNRMCEGPDPILEKTGNRAGTYRRIEKELNEVNFLSAPTEEFPVEWPMEIEYLSVLYPGNIAVVAGSKSSGKTGFLLNVVKNNMHKHDIVYLNSEMGDTEFRKRLELFEDLKLKDWKFKAYHRSSNFADLITSEKKIFIVDFLEITDNFWKIAQYIKEIHDKLKDGICIIGLQKSQGKETGRGGDFSKEKSRLYINLDYIPAEKRNEATIIDAKAWRTTKNPRGMKREYKLVKGSVFFPMGGWRDE